MISKVITGRSFRGCCRYVCRDQTRAVVLETEGVRGHNYKLMADDFETQQQLRPSKQKAVFHGILSFYPGENPSDEKMVLIARSYLEKSGIRDTQYSITKHIDKNHLHLHVIANLVNNWAEAISDSWLGVRAKKISQQLTIQHELKQAVSKDLKLTNLEALNEYEATRYRIFQIITDTLPDCRDLDQVRAKLLNKGIDTLYKFKGQTQEPQGISFRMGSYSFKGSQVDREFSFKKLESALNLNQQKKLKQGISQQTVVTENQQRRSYKYRI